MAKTTDPKTDINFVPRYSLRPERVEDLEALTALLVAVDASWGEVPFRVAVREGGFKAARAVIARSKVDSIVAEIDCIIVGYGALRQDSNFVWFTNMLVAPEEQRKGIGRAIAESLCQKAKGSGEHIHLDVLLDSKIDRNLYESLGFKEIGVTIGKNSGRKGLLMCLEEKGCSLKTETNL